MTNAYHNSMQTKFHDWKFQNSVLQDHEYMYDNFEYIGNHFNTVLVKVKVNMKWIKYPIRLSDWANFDMLSKFLINLQGLQVHCRCFEINLGPMPYSMNGG